MKRTRSLMFPRGLILSAVLCGASLAAAAPAKPREVRQMILDGQFIAADARIQDALESAPDAEKETWLFLRAWGAIQAGQYQRALEVTDQLLGGKPLLEEEIRSLRASALELLNRKAEALAEDRILMQMAPNFHLRFDTTMRTARVKLSEGKPREARGLLAALEKRARGTSGHAEVMIELARAEKRLGSSSAACRWLKRLYSRSPLNPTVHAWGPDLASNEFDGKPTGCHNTKGDFRDRVRALLWGGEEDKARGEVHQVVEALARDSRVSAEEMKAWYLLQTGEPDEAFTILQALYPQRKSDTEFLQIYASAAARSGQGAAAVGAYHQIYERSGRGNAARKALYQSAFLSYQFRDYDGASRRFKEFMQKFPTSGLQRDAKWNLAWISYLKGDYDGAIRQFQLLAGNKKAAKTRERSRYWMAMSYLKLNQPEKARPLFESIGADRSGSYYGAAARQRLTKLPKVVLAAKTSDVPEEPRLYGPLRWSEMLMPIRGVSDEDIAEDGESEESLANEAVAAGDDDTEEATTDVVQETGRSDVAEDFPPLKAPANNKRFEKAKALLNAGFGDEARWELFEIERHTRSKEDLRNLLAIYEEAGQYHRSSVIAQLRFGGARTSQGIEGARPLWEAAYPRAFGGDVKSAARDNSLPEEFIWGIMKAESQFKRDAVSPVGALGLMQIMPGTGHKLASLRKDDGFLATRLLEPPTAIRYGAYYLKRLSNLFDGSIPLTAAAYNAGPHRVHGWLIAFGGLEMDEFIEHIPFLETREYVRKVVGNALVYSALYNNKRDLVDLAAPVTVKGRAEWSRKENWN